MSKIGLSSVCLSRFYIKCTRCLQEISFRTDPKSTDYEIEAGAIRNFMALKKAEEQAKKEVNVTNLFCYDWMNVKGTKLAVVSKVDFGSRHWLFKSKSSSKI